MKGDPNLTDLAQFDLERVQILDGLERDRWQRFREFAGPEVAKTIDESERLRVEFIRQVQVMLSSDARQERSDAAYWIGRHAYDVAYWNAMVRAMFREFLMGECQPIRVRMP